MLCHRVSGFLRSTNFSPDWTFLSSLMRVSNYTMRIEFGSSSHKNASAIPLSQWLKLLEIVHRASPQWRNQSPCKKKSHRLILVLYLRTVMEKGNHATMPRLASVISPRRLTGGGRFLVSTPEPWTGMRTIFFFYLAVKHLHNFFHWGVGLTKLILGIEFRSHVYKNSDYP